MKKPLSAKKIAIILAIVALVSFGYKLTIGVLATSLVMIVAAVPAFFIFVCKAAYAKNMNQTREEKKRAYFIMAIATAAFATIFVLFSILMVGGIDITNQNRFTGWIGLIFILFIILLFILSIINLRGALGKDDLVVIGIKEITFMSALTDAVMIQEFLYRVINAYIDVKIPFFDLINKYFPLGIGILMILIPISMFRRLMSYEA